MTHRHVDLPAGHWNREAIESVFERGADADVLALLQAIRRDPWGEVADLAVAVTTDSDYYGWSQAIPRAVERWRKEKSA